MPRILVVTLIIILSLLSLGLLLTLNFEKKIIYPFGNASSIQIGISHEEITSDWSEGSYFVDKNNILHFNYTLSSKVPEPFTAVYLHQHDSVSDSFLDFSRFDILSIQLSAKRARRIPIFLTVDYKGFTTSGKPLSWVPLSTVLEYKGEGVYELKKSDFEIPSWWLRYQGMNKESFSNINFSRVTYIIVNSCQTLGAGKEDEIQIRSISFSHSNKNSYLFFGGLTLACLATFGLIYFIKNKKKVLVPYRTSEVGKEKSASKINQIVEFIAQHYTNPELAANDLQQALGITEREVGALIKVELGSSFKSYLNTIRLAEVKRLLQESDRPVSEIAYLTGYNNIPHFNRVFKKEFDTTPKEFREHYRIKGDK